MAMFLAGLEKFKRWGPPSVKSNPITLEEVEFAKTMNSFEGDAVYEELLQVEIADQYLMEVWDEEDVTPEKFNLKQAVNSDVSSSKVIISVCDCQCLCPSLNRRSANLPVTEDSDTAVIGINFSDLEKISPLCKLKLIEDG